jgi:hypothetical protein
MGWARSFSEVKKLAGQDGLRVNDVKVAADHGVKKGDVIQYGKRRLVEIE